MAGMDLLTGYEHRAVAARHYSQEFVKFPPALHEAYPKDMALWLILDRHSAHISKQTRTCLASQHAEPIRVRVHAQACVVAEPDRDVLQQGGKDLLRGIRVASTDELKERLERYIDEINAEPVVIKWTHGIDGAIRLRDHECYFGNGLLSELQAIHQHWGIENQRHWVLDIIFDENRSHA